MSHDKIRAAARRRMTATGETYTEARRQAINEHISTQSTAPISAEDILAAAEVHQELGPEYSDAVVASFIDKVDRAVDARVDARLADLTRSESAKPAKRTRPHLTRRVARDVLAASAGALVAVGAVGLHEITSPHPGPPASKLATGGCANRAGNSPCFVPAGTKEVRRFVITSNGQVTVVAPDPGPR
jgi:hypothetical protein